MHLDADSPSTPPPPYTALYISDSKLVQSSACNVAIKRNENNNKQFSALDPCKLSRERSWKIKTHQTMHSSNLSFISGAILISSQKQLRKAGGRGVRK